MMSGFVISWKIENITYVYVLTIYIGRVTIHIDYVHVRVDARLFQDFKVYRLVLTFRPVPVCNV